MDLSRDGQGGSDRGPVNLETTNSRNPAIFDLSVASGPPSRQRTNVLKKGLKFTPSPLKVAGREFNADMHCTTRKMKLADFHRNFKAPSIPDSSLVCLKSQKAGPKPKDPSLLLLCNNIEKLKPKKNKGESKNNMSPDMFAALEELLKDEKITVKEADKGSGVVIMDTDYYMENVRKMLQNDTYERCEMDCTNLQKKVSSFVNKQKEILTVKELEGLTKQISFLATFNALPKIHKSKEISRATLTQIQSSIESPDIIQCPRPEDLTFRPIVSCQDCPTKNLAFLLDKLLRPFAMKVKFRLKDTWHFLEKLPHKTFSDGIAITADITSLYTNISTASGLKAIEYYIDAHPQLLPKRFSKKFVLDCFTFLQENLFFLFDGNVYRQKEGTGMGKIYAPSLADIKVGYDELLLEQELRDKLSAEALQHFTASYARYLDDIWLLWRRSWIHYVPIIREVMNSIDTSIKYTFESSEESPQNSVAYLDTKIKILDGGWVDIDIFSKKTDTFNYLPFNSAHPRHVVRNIPYCLARRIRGIVSDPLKVPIRMREMTIRLRDKGYPKKLIENAIEKAMLLTRDEIIKPSSGRTASHELQPDQKMKIYCVTTFDPAIRNPRELVQPAVERYNDMKTEEEERFKIEYSFRKSPSLKQLLTFKKPDKDLGVFKCLGGCKLCNENMHAGRTLTLKTGVVLTANARFECTTRNVVYVMICMGCKEFYVGETGDTLRNRFTVHRQQMALDPENAPVPADPHLRTCGGGRYKVFPFSKPNNSSRIHRRSLEDRWITVLKPRLNTLV